MKYINYIIPKYLIEETFPNDKIKNLIFYIDLNGMAKGFYNKEQIQQDILYFRENKTSNRLTIDLHLFINNIKTKFHKYNPRFIIFFDNGVNKQNSSIYEQYKKNRIQQKENFLSKEDLKTLRELKLFYYNEIDKKFNISDFSKVYYLREYESDLIPYYFINKFKLFEKRDTANIILSVDKDLLQCCTIPNTYQLINTYSKLNEEYKITLYNNENATDYISKDPELKLTSDYIPLILSLMGDKSDGIPGIERGYGIKTAMKDIINNKIPYDFDIDFKLPEQLDRHKEHIQLNLNLISFKRQLERIPMLQ